MRSTVKASARKIIPDCPDIRAAVADLKAARKKGDRSAAFVALQKLSRVMQIVAADADFMAKEFSLMATEVLLTPKMSDPYAEELKEIRRIVGVLSLDSPPSRTAPKSAVRRKIAV
jgi:hypothetical protein